MRKNLLLNPTTERRLKSVTRRWCLGAVAVAVAGICTAAATGDVKLKRSSVTYTNTEQCPDQSESSWMHEFEYTPEGLISTETITYGDTLKRSATTTHTYSGDSFSPFNHEREFTVFDTESTLDFYSSGKNYRLYSKDEMGRVGASIFFSSVNDPSVEGWTAICYAYTYDDEDNAWASEYTLCKADITSTSPFTYTLGDVIQHNEYVWHEPAKNYVHLSWNPSGELVLSGDTIVTTWWTDGSRTELKEKQWQLYSDGKKVMEKHLTIEDRYGEGKQPWWYGSRDASIEVDSVNRVTTTVGYRLTDNGEFFAASKEERSFNYGEPGYSGYRHVYSRNSPDEEWSLYKDASRKCVWKANAKIMEYYEVDSDNVKYEDKYDNDLKRLGTITRVSPSLYYVIEHTSSSYTESIVTYFNSSNQVDRKLKLSTKENYFYPVVRELRNGEWGMPVQPFWMKGYDREVNHPGERNTDMTEVTWNTTLDCPLFEKYFYYDSNKQQYVQHETRFWYYDEYSYRYQDKDFNTLEECSIKEVAPGILGLTLKSTPKYGNDSRSYTEYDKARRLVHNYRYDKTTNTYTYSYTDCLANNDFEIATADYTRNINVKYDRETDELSGDLTRTLKGENGSKTEWKYTLDPANSEWILTQETVTEVTPRPDWVSYDLAYGINVRFNYSQGEPSFSDPTQFTFSVPGNVLSYVYPDPTDTKTVVKKYDEATGEVASTTEEYYEYLDEPYFCERHKVKNVDGDITYPELERYEKNASGLLTAWYSRDEVWNKEKGFRYYYNNHNLLLRAERTHYGEWETPVVYLFSYYGESDEIDESGVEEVTMTPGMTFFVEGRIIRTVNQPEFAVYSIDGRKVAQATDGYAEVPDGGIYILVAGDKRVKVFVK